jgi:hypothetical protein
LCWTVFITSITSLGEVCANNQEHSLSRESERHPDRSLCAESSRNQVSDRRNWSTNTRFFLEPRWGPPPESFRCRLECGVVATKGRKYA